MPGKEKLTVLTEPALDVVKINNSIHKEMEPKVAPKKVNLTAHKTVSGVKGKGHQAKAQVHKKDIKPLPTKIGK